MSDPTPALADPEVEASTDAASTNAADTALLARIQAPEGEGREIPDAATRDVVGRAPVHTVADIDAAVARARAAQPAWDAVGHEERSRLLMAAADRIEANAEALARLLSREQGKPLDGPNARFEVGACAAWLRAGRPAPPACAFGKRPAGQRSSGS